MNDVIKKQIELLSTSPGCYQMFDKDNNIIYVGKAKNLKKRVSQYFLRPQVGKTAAMVSHVDHFETILTDTEKEALILEMNLIQKIHPKYNILLMDDKHYPYIELHKGIKDPYISIARNIKNKKSDFYGPYPSSSSAYQVISIINSIYPLRKCSSVKKSPCLYYHLGQCIAPCINKVSKEEYDKIIKSIESFLRGNNEEVIKELKKKIEKCSDELDFENAKLYKEQLDSILYINEKQNVEFIDRINRDFIGFYTYENYLSLIILIYRNGLLIAKKKFFYEIVGEINEFIADLLMQYYEINTLPKEIVISSEEIIELLKDSLKTTIILPKQGKNIDIISIAISNAQENFSSYLQVQKYKESNLILCNKLAQILNIPKADYIELFDNSHLQGSNAIGAMVAYINGEEVKSMNRQFNIESYNKKDDISSMREVIYRRYSRLKEENKRLPDLIIVDGGKEQIIAALTSLNKLGLNINLCGLVKNDKHQTRALMSSSLNEIAIDDKNLFLFLSRMQDSIHRFAITTHIRKRSKSMFKSIFDDIKGIGDKRKEMILKRFPSLSDLKKATIEELKQILPPETATALYDKLKEY